MPLQKRGLQKHGFYLKFFERVALPQVGRAALAYVYGDFDDAPVESDDLSDLRDAEVRIQISPKGDDAWRTVYWGTVDYVEDTGSPGALVPRGEKTFHLVDGFYRTKRWLMDRHGYDADGGAQYGNVSAGGAYGHPGYNFSHRHDSVSAGNKSSSQYLTTAGVSVYMHKPAGAGAAWTDLETLEHALAATKPAGEPLFTVSGATGLLTGANPWEVKAGESVLDFAMRVLKRERGRGLAFVDWDDDTAAPSGALTVKLTIGAQLADTVTYVSNFATGATSNIVGATALHQTTTVDISGDHRAVNGSLTLGNPDQFRVSYLETEGEPIEVLTTLAYIDGRLGTVPSTDGRTLMRGWSATDQTSYVALSVVRRQEARYRPIFQLHRLNPAWRGYAGDGNGGPIARVDYRCTKYGRVVTPDTASGSERADPAVIAETSPLLVEILPDLPLYESYIYTGAAVARNDGAAESANPERRKLTGFVRIGAARFLEFDQLSGGSVHMSVDGSAVWIVHSGDEGGGTRFFSSASTANLANAYGYEKLVLTVGLRLPHRVRLASGDPNTSAERGKVYVPGAHLWLAAPGAIYDLDTSVGSASLGYGARRGAVGSTETLPGVLRDDRAGLAFIHALSWAWFGSDTTHRSASWALKACGFLPTFSAYSGTEISGSASDIPYPEIGEVVTTLTANGADNTLNTPVTRVHYDAERAVTTWSTEWNELETK